MASLVETVGLSSIFEDAGISPARRKNFEALYSSISTDHRLQDLRQTVELKIKEYFDDIEIPGHVTIYDELLTTLRRKDLIASFNWDPLLVQAYFRNRGLRELPEIVFLHGNVGVGVCLEHRKNGFFGGHCGTCSKAYEQSPLLYPVAEKGYHNNAFIDSQWSRLELKLQTAFIVTIFGYSAPRSDVSARKIMRLAWKRNGARSLAEIEIIDVKPKRKLLKSWASFITGDHYITMRRASAALAYQFPRRSCDAWGWAVLQNDPWRERRLPRFKDLQKLHSWCEPLVAEELMYYENGAALEQWR